MAENTVTRAMEIGLRITGIWPGASYVIASRLLWTAAMLTALNFQYRYMVLQFDPEDLSPIMDGMSLTLSYSLLIIKLTMFWTNKRIFNDVLAIIATNWKEHGDTDRALCSMSKVADFSKRFSNFIIGLHSVAVLFYGVGVVALRADNDDAADREMLVKMELPFESNKSPIYELVLTTQFLHQMSAATVNGVISALLVTLVLHAGNQIDILRDKILELLPRDKKPTIMEMGSLIRRHQSVIVLIEKIEGLYSYIALAQFIANTFVICSLGFVLVNSMGTDQRTSMIMKSLLFYIVINLEAFLFCFAGEYLSVKSTMIGDVAYESSWYDLTPSECRVLLLLIMRSQRQLTITVGKFANLSLRQFGNIVKTSASYISVLLAV